MAFCAAYFWSKPLAFVLLTMHVLLDGLDGPLARHVGAASRRGSFTDTLADQIVVAATTVTLMSTGTLSVVPGSFYIFVYTLVVVFAFVRNALSIPYSWLVRPRFIVFAWLPVDTWLVPGSLDYAVWGFDVFLTLKLLTGFIKIRRMI
jgi:phosphatidylglycerophosphate synthase